MGVEATPATALFRPALGKRFIVLVVRFENMTNTWVPISPTVQQELTDSTHHVYPLDDRAVSAAGGRWPPDSIPPLSTLLREVGYQVPQVVTGLRWSLKDRHGSKKHIVFDIPG